MLVNLKERFYGGKVGWGDVLILPEIFIFVIFDLQENKKRERKNERMNEWIPYQKLLKLVINGDRMCTFLTLNFRKNVYENPENPLMQYFSKSYGDLLCTYFYHTTSTDP